MNHPLRRPSWTVLLCPRRERLRACGSCLSLLTSSFKGHGLPTSSPCRTSATARIYVGPSSLRQLSVLNLKLSYQSSAEGRPRTNLLHGPNFPFPPCRRQAADISHLRRAKDHLGSPLPALQPSAQHACSEQKAVPLNCRDLHYLPKE